MIEATKRVAGKTKHPVTLFLTDQEELGLAGVSDGVADQGDGRVVVAAGQLAAVEARQAHIGDQQVNAGARLQDRHCLVTIAGLYGSTAVMIALREVEQKGGKGQVIDLPLLDPVFVVLGPLITFAVFNRAKPRRELKRDLAAISLAAAPAPVGETSAAGEIFHEESEL